MAVGIEDPPVDLLNDISGLNPSFPDTLKLCAIKIDMEQAQNQVTGTNFLHRLVPQVHVSASFGIRDLIFIDPSNSLLTVLPKDAYRLSVSLSISELFDLSKHRAAEFRLARLQIEHTHIQQLGAESRLKLQRESAGLNVLSTFLSDELKLKEEVLKFNELRFQQGKIEYDALIRSKLDVLNVKKSIFHLNQQKNEIRLNLHDEVLP